MTTITAPCDKCGQPLPVDEQLLANAVSLGVALTIAHDDCPTPTTDDDGEALPLRSFRLQLVAVELPEGATAEVVLPAPTVDGVPCEVLAGVGRTFDTTGGFAETVNGPMTTWLNETWPKFQESAAFADLPPVPPAPSD